jgi:hypothetical protein
VFAHLRHRSESARFKTTGDIEEMVVSNVT